MRISPLILSIAGVIVLLLIGLAVFFFLRTTTSTPATTTDQTGAFTTSTDSTSAPSLNIPTQSGTVTVHDVRAYSDTTDVGENSYVVGGTATSSATDPYQITFYAPDLSYSITLLKEPLGAARKNAETELLQKLGITKEEACKLSISVGTPVWVSETLGGRDLGLSFCPGAVAF